MPSIDWLPWATPAFQRAQQARKPVLLLLDTAWSTPCRDFETRVLSVPAIVDVVTSDFVPVRVDADWRPDIADRYGLGQWPTLLALTPEGHVLGGGTAAEIPLAFWLTETARLFRLHDGSLPTPPRSPTPAPGDQRVPLDEAAAATEIWAQVAEAIDPVTGAFGAQDQPALESALAGLAGGASGLAPELADPAVATIDALLASPRWDAPRGLLLCRGGTYLDAGERFARLDNQAEWIRLLVRGLECDPRPAWREALESAVRGLQREFAGPSDGWAPWSGGPPNVFVDATARACRALLAAAVALDEPAPAAAAIAAIEAILPKVYDRGAGLAHVLTTRRHGPTLLSDTVVTAHALLDADPWRDQPVYRDLAEELVRSAFARLSDPGGALVDRRHSLAGGNAVGRLSHPHFPLEANAEAVRLCVRLGPTDDTWRTQALRVLGGIHGEGRQAAGFAAPLALAWAAVIAPEHAISVW